MERVLQHLRRGLADPHALLRVVLLQHAVQRAPAGAAALQQLGRVSRWAGRRVGAWCRGGTSGVGRGVRAWGEASRAGDSAAGWAGQGSQSTMFPP